jgi:hypothetical protein
MARMTIADAARAIGKPRETLRDALKRHGITKDADGLIDTEALIRVGYTNDQLELITHESPCRATEPSAQENTLSNIRQAAILQQYTALIGQLQEECRKERAQAALREQRLFRALEQLSRSLLETVHPAAASDRLEPIRTRVLKLLKDTPGALTRYEIETALQTSKNLRHVLQGMVRAKLLVRPKPGVYMLSQEPLSPQP